MKVQRKLTIVIVMVLLTIVALGTSTYAWFTLNNIAKVDQIEMGITSGVGIEVSLDGKEWFNILDSDKIADKVKDVKFESVTTSDGINMLTLDGGTAADNTYIKFDIYFRASNVNVSDNNYGIFLGSYNSQATFANLGSGTALKSEGVDWRPDVNYFDWDGSKQIEYKTTDEAKKYYVENSMRVSFVDKKDGKLVRLFDLNESSKATLKRGYAETYDEAKTAYGAFSYYNIKTGSNKSLPENAAPYKEGLQLVHNDELTIVDVNANTNNNNSLICNLSKEENSSYYIGSTELRVWAEGWDIDCFDSVLKDKIKLQLQFQFGKVNK